MPPFPAVDPIPLPAPVWLFKVLHILTLALHFITVEMLLGGLAIALVLNLTGRGGDERSAIRLNASASLARRLPALMTYVINLGVPPLLFAQVLYGRALYTSSVLIGMFWISVVFLLIGCYWHIYKFTGKIENGKRAWPMALIALGLAVAISRIYSTNMTLMLHPSVWQEMYSKSALGNHLPPFDPTLTPRWAFMLVGGLAAGGLWMIWLAGKKTIEPPVRSFLSATGGKLALVALAAEILLAMQVMNAQPESVRAGMTNDPIYHYSTLAWLGGVVVLIAIAGWCAMAKPVSTLAGWGALGAGLVTMLSMTLCRDGIRDLTLKAAGYDVWNRAVAANWSVVAVFLVVFVAGLAAMGWLISVLLRAKPTLEKVV